MKKINLFPFAVLLWTLSAQAQVYNDLRIPDTLSGTMFNLTVRDTFRQVVPAGNQTITGGINSDIWGPTLFFNKGDTVHMNVQNNLNDSTTIHWHGMHLPAVMDGGPHQVIPPGTLWQPYWKVTNNAGLFWFHPHLHMETMHQITQGIGGLIIVRDSIESALPLPRTYGIDDIPLVLTDRDINTSNQFVDVPYGDSLMVNGVLRPQFSVPAQVVRFRILNGAIERSYNLGFSDNRTFYVISTDGGLVDNPVPVTRFLISAGERVEILVDFSGQASSSFDLKAYNSTLSNFIPGGENFPNGPFANALGKIDFRILHLNVGVPTSQPITTIPSTLTTNTFYDESSANLTRVITLTDSTGVPNILGPNAFILNHHLFDLNTIDYTVPLNNTEIWQLTSNSIFAHPFHIHDVEFYILTRNGIAPPDYEKGWKDVVLVKGGETVRFIAKFDDYADLQHPFMFHCHIALHEDEGMMGQFVVGPSTTGVQDLSPSNSNYAVHPNPAKDKLYIDVNDQSNPVYYATITNVNGKALVMMPQPQTQQGIEIGRLRPGTYFLTITDTKNKKPETIKFIKE